MYNFLKKYGMTLLWFVFIYFIILEIGMIFTHGLRYALVLFFFTLVLLCPPVIKFIQQKTRIREVVLVGTVTVVMGSLLLMSNHFSAAQKEEQLKISQERKEQKEKTQEENSQDSNSSEKNNQTVTNVNSLTNNEKNQTGENKNTSDINNQNTVNKKSNAANANDTSRQNNITQRPKAVRASKKNGRFYVEGQPGYNNIAQQNLVVFNSEEQARKAGYRQG